MSIKKLNATDPGVKRPVRCSDFQDIWSGLYEALASGTIGSTTPQIITGLTIDSENDYALTSGLLAYNGMLYYFDSTEATINEGDNIYAGYIADAERNFSDGSVKPFSYSYVLRNTNTGLTDVYLIGRCTISNIAAWRVSGIPDASIPVVKVEQVNYRYSVALQETCSPNETLFVNVGTGAAPSLDITFDDMTYRNFKCFVSSSTPRLLMRLFSLKVTGGTDKGLVFSTNLTEDTFYEIEYVRNLDNSCFIALKALGQGTIFSIKAPSTGDTFSMKA